MKGCMRTLLGAILVTSVLFMSQSAMALPNDLTLYRLGQFQIVENEDCVNLCGFVPLDANNQPVGTEDFRNLTADLGHVFAPRLIAPSETLGQAGFAVKLMTSFSTIPNEEDYWRNGVEGRNPDPVLFTSHLQVRKGLPFSFEVVGNLSYLFASEMFAMGADLRWALNEGFDWFPDVAVRGSVNTVVGAPELNMINAAWDLSMSKSFGLAGVTNITPYVGYQQLYTIASTRVLNAYPQDPRPPQFSTSNPNVRFAPEFVYSQYTSQGNRFFLGGRLNTWILSFTLEAVFGERVNQFTFAGGFDF